MDSAQSEAVARQMASEEKVWSVVCLCAAWCGVCRQYESDFMALQARFSQVRFVWVDVEDQETLVGDVDVETFPSLLIGVEDRAMFFGPLLPQIKILERLLESLLQGQPASSSLSPEATGLWQRVATQWQ